MHTISEVTPVKKTTQLQRKDSNSNKLNHLETNKNTSYLLETSQQLRTYQTDVVHSNHTCFFLAPRLSS